MNHVLDVDLHDTELDSEIHLLGELMVRASESGARLDLRTIDATLGLRDGRDVTVPGPRRG